MAVPLAIYYNIFVEKIPLGPDPSDRHPEAPVTPIASGRAQVLNALRSTTEALSVAQLQSATGLHVNTLRGHLDALLHDGEATRAAAPSTGRGRPAWLYRPAVEDPAATELAGLAMALAEALIEGSPTPDEAAARAGIGWGVRLAQEVAGLEPGTPFGSPSGSPSDIGLLRSVLSRMGFAPEAAADPDVVRLTRCPLLEAARARPEIVCNVHRGVVQGVLRVAGAADRETRLQPFAEPGACLLFMGGAVP